MSDDPFAPMPIYLVMGDEDNSKAKIGEISEPEDFADWKLTKVIAWSLEQTARVCEEYAKEARSQLEKIRREGIHIDGDQFE